MMSQVDLFYNRSVAQEAASGFRLSSLKGRET
jgi:hypothetical protein